MDFTHSTLVLVQCNESDPLAGWLAASQDQLSNQDKWLLCWQKGSPCICEESILRRSLLLLSSTEEYLLDLTVSFHLPKLAVFRTGPPCTLQCTALICIRAIVRKTLHCNVIAAICNMHYCKIQISIALQCYCSDASTCRWLESRPVSLQSAWCDLGRCNREALLAEMTSVSDFYMKSIPHFAKMFVNWWHEWGRTEW